MTCKDCVHYEVCKRIDDKMEVKNMSLNETIQEMCRDFKNKSKYIELPCKVGDEIWYIPGYVASPHLLVGTITVIQISSNDYGVRIWQTPYNGYFMGKNFNVNWLTNREKAEQKLKELQNDKERTNISDYINHSADSSKHSIFHKRKC